MRCEQIFFLVFFLLFCITKCDCKNTNQQDKPFAELKIIKNDLEFSVKKGEILKGKFAIENVGNSDLNIQGITSTCPCTIADLKNKVVKSKNTEWIYFSFNTKGKKVGYHFQPVIIISNAVKKYSKVVLKFSVKP